MIAKKVTAEIHFKKLSIETKKSKFFVMIDPSARPAASAWHLAVKLKSKYSFIFAPRYLYELQYWTVFLSKRNVKLDCFFLFMSYHGTSKLKKKINELEIWASTEVKPSNEIEIHKAKKDSKFNFILISDCLADIYPTQKSQFNS